MKTTLLLFTSKLKCGDQAWSCYTHLSSKDLALFIQCRDRCGRLRVCNKHIHGLDVLALLGPSQSTVGMQPMGSRLCLVSAGPEAAMPLISSPVGTTHFHGSVVLNVFWKPNQLDTSSPCEVYLELHTCEL